MLRKKCRRKNVKNNEQKWGKGKGEREKEKKKERETVRMSKIRELGIQSRLFFSFQFSLVYCVNVRETKKARIFLFLFALLPLCSSLEQT